MRIQVDIQSEENGPTAEFYDVEGYTTLVAFIVQYMTTKQGWEEIDYKYSNLDPSKDDLWIGNGDGIIWVFNEIDEIKFEPFIMNQSLTS